MVMHKWKTTQKSLYVTEKQKDSSIIKECVKNHSPLFHTHGHIEKFLWLWLNLSRLKATQIQTNFFLLLCYKSDYFFWWKFYYSDKIFQVKEHSRICEPIWSATHSSTHTKFSIHCKDTQAWYFIFVFSLIKSPWSALYCMDWTAFPQGTWSAM